MDEQDIPKPAWLQREQERLKKTKQILGRLPTSKRSATPPAAGTGTAPVILGSEAGTLPTDVKYSSEIATGIKTAKEKKREEDKVKKTNILKKRLGLG